MSPKYIFGKAKNVAGEMTAGSVVSFWISYRIFYTMKTCFQTCFQAFFKFNLMKLTRYNLLYNQSFNSIKSTRGYI